MPSIRWQPGIPAPALAWSLPPMLTALGRGFLGRCPACGKGHVFAGFLTVVPECSACHAPLGLARADDAPPYFTILITGHIVIPLMLLFERTEHPSTLLMSAIFIPLTLLLSVGLLRPVKGATVGLMMKLNMLKTSTDEA
jgi:uncharacterized protein (DUF983 family)